MQSGELAAAPDQVLAGDFDGDGQTDLAVLATTADSTTYTSLSRLVNNEHDGFLQESPSPVSWGVTDCLAAPPPTCVRPLVTTGDINGDGRDDITVIGGQATGAASTETDVTGPGPRLSGLLAGDVNGDGLTDEVSVAMASDSTVEVRTYLGAEDGRPTRLPPVTVSVADAGLKHLPADGWRLADVTGDHQADLVNLPPGARYGVILVATSAHGWTEHTINLTGLNRVIQGPPTRVTVSCTPKPIHCITTGGTPTTIDEPALLPRTGEWQIADVTGDGIADLVHAGPGPWGAPGVLVLAGSPSGVLTTEWTPGPGRNVRRRPAGHHRLAPGRRQRRWQRRPGGRRHRVQPGGDPAAPRQRVGAGRAGLHHHLLHHRPVPAPDRLLPPRGQCAGGGDRRGRRRLAAARRQRRREPGPRPGPGGAACNNGWPQRTRRGDTDQPGRRYMGDRLSHRAVRLLQR